MTGPSRRALLGALLMTGLGAGCASAPPAQPPEAPPTEPAASQSAADAPAVDPSPRDPEPATAPEVDSPALWELAADAAPSQRLFRLRFEGPEGDGTLRLVLRLASPERYRLSVSDRLGRPLFTLSAAPDVGLLLDHRRRRFCSLPGSIRMTGVPVDPLPLPALPRLLLGRLPLPPAAWPEPSTQPEGGDPLEIVDREGRRWTASQGDGDLESWTLWERGEPAAWWGIRDGEQVLSDRVRGVQMTWREVAREELALPLDVVGIPAGFTEGGCGDLLEASPLADDPPGTGAGDEAGADRRLTRPGERL